MGVGGGVGAGRTHWGGHVAVVVEHGAVARVRGRRLGGGGVRPAQQRCGPPVNRLVRPEGEDGGFSAKHLHPLSNVSSCVQ